MLVVLLTKSRDIYDTGNLIQSSFFVTDNQTLDVEHQIFIRYCEIIGNLGGLIFADIVVTPHP